MIPAPAQESVSSSVTPLGVLEKDTFHDKQSQIAERKKVWSLRTGLGATGVRRLVHTARGEERAPWHPRELLEELLAVVWGADCHVRVQPVGGVMREAASPGAGRGHW